MDIQMLKTQRYGTAGLAHGAADAVNEATGEHWRMSFEPRRRGDIQPFRIVKVEDRE